MMARTTTTYRGWEIRFDPKPGPPSALDWEAMHPEWEGDPDAPHTRRAFTAASREDLEREIDALEEENGWKVGTVRLLAMAVGAFCLVPFMWVLGLAAEGRSAWRRS